MRKECKHIWNPCGNNFYYCSKCKVMRTANEINLYQEKDKQIAELQQQLAEKDEEIERLKHKLDVEYPCIIMNYRDMLKSLKTRLYAQPQEIVEKIKQEYIAKKVFFNEDDDTTEYTVTNKFLNEILKEYGE